MRQLPPGTRALRCLEAAGRHLNFTRAADELGLTPAAVSHQIKEMEEQLGLVLFTRSSRSMQPTAAGAVLLEAAAEALELLRRATGRARQLSRGEARLRLSLGARFATHWLLPRLPRFRAAHPEIELRFDICDELRDFEADDVDAAIRFGTGQYAQTLSERLFDATVVPVCSPALLAAGPPITQPRDLLEHTLCHVDCMVDGQVWPQWSAWMAAAGVSGLDESRCIAFTDSSHVVQAVMDGGAVGLVEQDLVSEDLARGRLLRLFDIGVGLGPAYAYHFVYPLRSQGRPAIESLRTWLLAEAGHPLRPGVDRQSASAPAPPPARPDRRGTRSAVPGPAAGPGPG
ncbi:MAG: LysR family transcriptional regulator [Burkholderiaceae bacterium]|jgi:LysR family glycine cleavage system transcriptional activator|nr:LysR family transcriptional regulator [Burkholderiaceae bacterium]